jgi:DNA/RNA-binding protein KIN17
MQVIDKYEAIIQMQESKDQLRVDQVHLETVIPNVGRRVRVVNGPYAGADAKLLVVDFQSFSCKIMIESGSYTGRVIQDVQYEDICKLA